MSCCDGKPISKLPKYTLPYLGNEEFAFVQEGATRSGPLSSFVGYLSSNLVTVTEFGALSNIWQEVYDIVITDEGAFRWDSNYNLTQSLSNSWQSVYSTVFTLSDTWNEDLNVVSEFQAASGSWEDTRTVVELNSAQWGEAFDSSAIAAASGSWNSTYSTVNSLSDLWAGELEIVSTFTNLSSNWQNTYNTVDSNSARWETTYSTVCSNSCAWDDAFFIISCTDETSDIYPGTVNTFRIPYDVELVQLRANVNDAPVGQDIVIDIKSNGSTIFNTPLTIDAGTKTSIGSSNPYTLNNNRNLIDDDEITIIAEQVGTTEVGTGLKVTFIGNRKGCL